MRRIFVVGIPAITVVRVVTYRSMTIRNSRADALPSSKAAVKPVTFSLLKEVEHDNAI